MDLFEQYLGGRTERMGCVTDCGDAGEEGH